MTTITRPPTRTNSPLPSQLGRGRPQADNQPSAGSPSADQADNQPGGDNEAGLDGDSVYSYGLDGIPAGTVDPSGGGDAQDRIDLEALAEQVYLLLRREALLERERRGARH